MSKFGYIFTTGLLLFAASWHFAIGESHIGVYYPSYRPVREPYNPYYGHIMSNGMKCDATIKCKSEHGFICIDGMCTCQFSQSQYVDTKAPERKCLSMVHGPCLLANNVSMPCTPHANCVQDLRSSMYHKCECADGFIESSQRTCELAYGQPCGMEVSDFCDHIGGLVCVEGTCKCKEASQVFDEKEKKCRGIVGAVCQFMESDYCTGGTSCIQFFRDKNSLYGICACNPGLKWNGNECAK